MIREDDQVHAVLEQPNQPPVTTDDITVPTDELLSVGVTYDGTSGEMSLGVTDLSDPSNPVTTVTDPETVNLPDAVVITDITIGDVNNPSDGHNFVDNLRVFNASMDETTFEEQADTYGDEGQDNVVAVATFDDDVSDGDDTGSDGDDGGSDGSSGSGSESGSGSPTLTVHTPGQLI